MNQVIITKIEQYVRWEMDELCAAHDFQHIQRVVINAKKIHNQEKTGNILIIEAGALLHESLDEKFFDAWWIKEKKADLRITLESFWITTQEVQEIIFIAENVW